MMIKPKISGKNNSQLSVSTKEDNPEKSPTSRSVVGNQLVEYVPDQVEGLVKMIEKNGIELEDELHQGGKRPIEVGGTPEEQRRASKFSKSKVGGTSKIALPAKN